MDKDDLFVVKHVQRKLLGTLFYLFVERNVYMSDKYNGVVKFQRTNTFSLAGELKIRRKGRV